MSSFLLVTLRHLRYFLDPVPSWVWDLQLPGLIAGYVLPVSLVYILVVRSFSEREKYSSPANMLLLALLLAISGIGVLMHAFFKPDLVGVKLFVARHSVLRACAAAGRRVVPDASSSGPDRWSPCCLPTSSPLRW